MEPVQHLLVFGASGAIGSTVVRSAVQRGWQVTAVARKLPDAPLPGVQSLAVDPLNGDFVSSLMEPISEPGKYANWIAPPKMGIDNKPGDFEYVRIES